jgi:hypothetical protein
MTETDSRATNAGGDGRFQLLHRRLDAIISNQIRSNSNHFHSNGAKKGGIVVNEATEMMAAV